MEKQDDKSAQCAIEPTGEDEIGSVLDTLRGIAQQQAELLIPAEPIDGGDIRPNSKYNPITHVQLCRMRLMGLSNASAARAVGISPTTLTNWFKLYPKLSADMDYASALSDAQAASLLRLMMCGNGPTAFRALKLYLSTHLPEFQASSKVEVEHDFKEVARRIRAQLYGLPDTQEEEGKEASELAADHPPLLDVSSSSPAPADPKSGKQPRLANRVRDAIDGGRLVLPPEDDNTPTPSPPAWL